MNPGALASVCVYGCYLLSLYAVLYTLLTVTMYVLHTQLGCDIPGSVDQWSGNDFCRQSTHSYFGALTGRSMDSWCTNKFKLLLTSYFPIYHVKSFHSLKSCVLPLLASVWFGFLLVSIIVATCYLLLKVSLHVNSLFFHMIGRCIRHKQDYGAIIFLGNSCLPYINVLSMRNYA